MADLVTVTIDGRQYQVPDGELLIKVAQDEGVYIPRFCWHERMKPVGMCRMCLVGVEGVRGLPPACTTRVTDGMVVDTQSAGVRKAQEGVLEFLLINHPLDCPVCDRGGECPLQDHTLAFGPGESRYVEEKRHFEKPIPLSEVVDLDRERCIQCARCTRFAEEIAGDPLIDFVERGDRTQVLTFPDEPFSSYFSGNTVQICPVGALLARPYRFRARPWDLETVETSCQSCAVHCRSALQSSTNRLVRLLGVDSEPVNHGWLCDKGRFAFEYVHDAERMTNPMVRKGNEFVEVSWPEALDAAADGLTEAVAEHGPDAIALIGGARCTNEDAYVWSRLMKGVLGSDNVDCQVGDGLPGDMLVGLPPATIADCDTAKAVVLLGPDLKEELPVLYLRLRRAAVELEVPLVDVATRDHGLSRYAAATVRYAPAEPGPTVEALVDAVRTGDASGDGRSDVADAARILAEGEGHVVVVLGRPSLAEPASATVRAVAALAQLPNVRFLSALRRGNVHGALDMGLSPGVLPGRSGLESGREWFGHHWGVVPAGTGLDTEGILRAAIDGRIKALVILGSNPVGDFPDRDLAKQAMEAVPFLVACGGFLTETSRHANVLLPSAMYGEKDGTATNIEGRVQRLARKVTPAGTTMDDWRIAAELALRLDVDFDLESVFEVQAEIARVAPAYAEVTPRNVLLARDGIVVPAGREAIVLGRPGHVVAPMADADIPPIGGDEVQVIIQGRIVPPAEQHDAFDAGAGIGEEPLEPAEPAADASDASTGEESAEPAEPPELAEPSGPPRPALHHWDGSVEVLEIPALDSYALRLVSSRKLYDDGLGVQKSPFTAPLAPPATLVVSPFNYEQLGVQGGEKVKITSSRGSLVLPVLSDPGTPKGVAWLAFNQPDHGAGDIIDASGPVTDIRVETLQ